MLTEPENGSHSGPTEGLLLLLPESHTLELQLPSKVNELKPGDTRGKTDRGSDKSPEQVTAQCERDKAGATELRPKWREEENQGVKTANSGEEDQR